MNVVESIFARKFAITECDIERYMAAALSTAGDYADLYFEHVTSVALSIDESIVKTATQGTSQGVGIRVISGERTGYAHSDDLAPDKILNAARVAARIARGPSAITTTAFKEARKHDLYPMVAAPADSDLDGRADLIRRADRAARSFDPRVFQVHAAYADNVRQVLVATSEGRLSFDRLPLARLSVTVLARTNDGTSREGRAGGGGRVPLAYFETGNTPECFAGEAARQALVGLDAGEAPAGEMTVVLGPGWPGILLHEAVGHGLESDFNRKGLSSFTGRIGQRVASPLCTVVDDGTIRNGRGSLNVDDEGIPTRRNILIENGILQGYLQDKLSSLLMGTPSTGNGRRENYQYIPMPRMTNTYMLPGDSDPHDIVRSVSRGLFCARFGGGQVDITNGDFAFTATECYLIEDGKLTRPVRWATLIGNGPESLKHISMVGHDLQLDEGVGVCRKKGQRVPVGVGMPTVRIDRMMVGGGGR
jgi:TldD protein